MINILTDSTADIPKEYLRSYQIETIPMYVQVNGKIKDRIVVPAEADEEQIRLKAMENEKVQAAIGGKEPRKVIVVKSRLVNIVV